ncbi:hypothetical protein GON03_16950 [Nocardioides sp. MAH-18]|uniref:AbiEi antitoxin C-terminal domain-containing protein n=1 Tax=Nocardioides agri TaxID=2682843 RepID=A0A6L6XW04_9ACTN|nr:MULTISPECIES: hypothetical protein [unclassified Nocardioides]MBA2956029.1 hypothetical protein [Nocardioides sp. CGMCC 1.13656]MVQ50877.1 hypothetical protein [Nocardioides sp. MAH-18]
MSLSIVRPGVVAPVPVDPAGLVGPTPGRARGPHWRRVAKNLYVPADTDPRALEQRIVEAVAGCGATAAATGWAALAWAGARWFTGLGPDGRTPLPVPVAIGDRHSVRDRPGVEISEDWLFDEDVTYLDGLPVTVPERAVSHEARRTRSLLAAVTVIEMAAQADLVDRASMATYAVRLGSRPGIIRLREATAAAEENVWSPQETAMRLEWRRVRPLARLLCNAPLFDRGGRHLLTPDLVDPVTGVVGEYDGVVHLEQGAFRRDLERDALCRDLGLELVTMMSPDRRDVAAFAHRLRRAYVRASTRSGQQRTWTLERPDWWVDTSTVAHRRALTEHERVVWLRRGAS